MDGPRIRLARDRADFEACVTLQREVWRLADVEITSAIQLIATTWAGGLVHIAETPEGRPVGFAYAFPALRGGVPHLHSDMLAVRPEQQKRGVGLRLKWAQRAQAAELPRTVPPPVFPRINDVKWQAGWPVSSDPRLDLEAPELLLEIPPEWNVLCQAAPRVAAGWQEKVRRAFQAYLGRGYLAADFAPTEEGGRRRPLYVLKK